MSLEMPGTYVDSLYFGTTNMMPMVPSQDHPFSTQSQYSGFYAGSTIPLMTTTTLATPTPYHNLSFGDTHQPNWNAAASNFAGLMLQTPLTSTQAAVPPPAQPQPSRPRRVAFVNALEAIQTRMARPARDDSPKL